VFGWLDARMGLRHLLANELLCRMIAVLELSAPGPDSGLGTA
jgi:hypothetical protein